MYISRTGCPRSLFMCVLFLMQPGGNWNTTSRLFKTNIVQCTQDSNLPREITSLSLSLLCTRALATGVHEWIAHIGMRMTFPDQPISGRRRCRIHELAIAASLNFTQHRGSYFSLTNIPIDSIYRHTRTWQLVQLIRDCFTCFLHGWVSIIEHQRLFTSGHIVLRNWKCQNMSTNVTSLCLFAIARLFSVIYG